MFFLLLFLSENDGSLWLIIAQSKFVTSAFLKILCPKRAGVSASEGIGVSASVCPGKQLETALKGKSKKTN